MKFFFSSERQDKACECMVIYLGRNRKMELSYLLRVSHQGLDSLLLKQTKRADFFPLWDSWPQENTNPSVEKSEVLTCYLPSLPYRLHTFIYSPSL